MKKILIGGALAAVSVIGVAGPAFAHDCFNPKKTNTGGSIGIVTLDASGNEAGFTPLKDQGGFVTVDASAAGGPSAINIHVFGGHGGGKDGVAGGPNLADSDRACDGKGIDLTSACFGAG